jgi:O-antigen/teichoic acid export membrane protein
MIDKKALFINTASQTLVRFIALGLTLVALKILAVRFGTEGLGYYNTITTYVNFFLVIADLGLFSVTLREIAKNPENEKKILSNVLSIRAVSASIAVIAAIGIIFLTPYRNNPDILFGVIIATGFLFFNLLASIYDIVLQYRLKMQFSALAELLSRIVTIVALYLIVYFRGSFLLAMGTVALSGILIFAFKWLFARRFIAFGPSYNKEVTRWILDLSWPIGVVFIVNNLFFKLDTMMLFVIKGATAVGIYSVAYKVLEFTVFISSYFSSALKPVISKEIDQNKEYVAKIISRSLTLVVLASMPIAVVCIAFAREIVLFLSTPEFAGGAIALMILAVSLPIMYLDILLAEILIASDQRKIMLRIALFVLGFNFVANLIAIPLYSFVGAAITTLLSELLLLWINLHYTKKIVPFKIEFAQLLKILLAGVASIIFAALIRLTSIHFIIQIVPVLIVFGLMIFWLKVVKFGDIKALIKL